ncbi:hypothetical protein HUU40_12530 [candidate division KSB1 bacterium]|nr:hypothetical protein [candidate division KSB1 bacterium]
MNGGDGTEKIPQNVPGGASKGVCAKASAWRSSKQKKGLEATPLLLVVESVCVGENQVQAGDALFAFSGSRKADLSPFLFFT